MDSMDQKLTYVTCFMTTYKEKEHQTTRNNAFYFARFCELADSGIQICLYADSEMSELIKRAGGCGSGANTRFPNVILMELVKIEDTWAYSQYKNIPDIGIPNKRNEMKDTTNFMICMNSKIDFVADAARKNPFNSSHFAWIDFGVTHVFKELDSCQHLLRFYGSARLAPRFLCIPGCLEKTSAENVDSFIESVNWRFCGGFFIGDKTSIDEFHSLHRAYFAVFLSLYKKIVWEVNFWAWLESTVKAWKPIWVIADHNDTLIHIPAMLYSVSLKSMCGGGAYTKIKYDYLKINGFHPSSASHYYCESSHRHFLNTRYVNYTINRDGYYEFDTVFNPENKIITRNVFSILDSETLLPKCFHEVDEKDLGILPKSGGWIEGVEDIRIFKRNGSTTELQFIATSVNYSDCENNRIVLGKYVIDNETGRVSLEDGQLLMRSEQDSCEKNWIPIGNEEQYIYGWSPFEIIGGNVNVSLSDKPPVDVFNSPICRKFRGSTVFLEIDNSKYLGIVHFTVGEGGNKYYLHCLVEIDKLTLLPIQYSQPFYFEKIQIEYCIGFYILKAERGGEEDKWCFWISQMDKDPLLIVCEMPNKMFFF